MKRFIPCVFLIVVLVCSADLHAQWSCDPAINTPVSTAAGSQVTPAMAEDGSGGVIIAWADSRPGNYDIYAQRLDAGGKPQWTMNGIPICTATNFQTNVQMIGDNLGGAFIVWEDMNSGVSNIFAQRVNSAGIVQWPANGVALAAISAGQTNPRIAGDGNGGIIVVWEDLRNGNSDIFAQRISGTGVVMWATAGLVICNAPDVQGAPSIAATVPDGVYILWQDRRNSADYDIYVQSIASSGANLFTPNGLALTAGNDDQTFPTAMADGLGGFVTTWRDARDGAGNVKIRAQRMDVGGSLLWGGSLVLSNTSNGQLNQGVVSDGHAGIFVVWQDARGVIDYDIYGQHVDAAGSLKWGTQGLAVCTAFRNQDSPKIIRDGSGGAILAWRDYRSSGLFPDIYAQRLGASGVALWDSGGTPVSIAVAQQHEPVMASNGSNGAIVAWGDSRNYGDEDIYAQRIDRYGYAGDVAPRIVAVKDVPNDQGGRVTVIWDRSYLDEWPNTTITRYMLFRGVRASALGSAQSPFGREELAAMLSSEAGLQGKLFDLSTSANPDPIYWQLITTLLPFRLPGYSFLSGTQSDSGL